MKLFHWIAIAFVGLLMGITGCRRTYGRQACRIENEVVLGSTGRVPLSVAIEAGPKENFFAAWSADNATFVAKLKPNGNTIGAAARIERAKRWFKQTPLDNAPKTFWPEEEYASFTSEHLGLLDAGDGKMLLTMLERPSEGRPGGAYAVLLPPDLKGNQNVLRLGPAYEYASGIAAAPSGGGLVIAWHEGSLSVSLIRLVLLETNPLRVVKEAVVPGRHALSGPALATAGNRVLFSWYETVHEGHGPPRSRVMVAQLSDSLEIGRKREIAICRFVEPSPALTRVGDHIGIVFRDDMDKDETPEFYYSLLDHNGVTIHPKKRISQADGLSGPSLVHTTSFLASATIRSFQRNLLVGVNRFDLTGVKQGGEFQVYADKTDFVRVDLATNANSLLMIYAEDQRKKGRVLASQVICKSDR